jgi:hypothetical protein
VTVTDAKLLDLLLLPLLELIASTCVAGSAAAFAGRVSRAPGANANANPWKVETPIFRRAARRVIRSNAACCSSIRPSQVSPSFFSKLESIGSRPFRSIILTS